jgi:hypothetical protein
MPLRRTRSAAWACILCRHVYRIYRSCLSTLIHLHVLGLSLALCLDAQRLSVPISSQGGCLALLGSPDQETRLYWREVSLTLSCRQEAGYSRLSSIVCQRDWHRHTMRQRRGRSSRAGWLTVTRGLSCEVPTGTITIPAKHPHHIIGETLLAAGRPLTPGERISVCFNVVRSTRSA